MELKLTITGTTDELSSILGLLKNREEQGTPPLVTVDPRTTDVSLDDLFDVAGKKEASTDKQFIEDMISAQEDMDAVFWTDDLMERLYSRITPSARKLMQTLLFFQTHELREGYRTPSSLASHELWGSDLTVQGFGGIMSSITRNLERIESQNHLYTSPIERKMKNFALLERGHGPNIDDVESKSALPEFPKFEWVYELNQWFKEFLEHRAKTPTEEQLHSWLARQVQEIESHDEYLGHSTRN